MRRARPLLGTVVEIEASGSADPVLERAITHAFDAVERVHRLMSFHDPDSDISRLNRHGASAPVTVDPWTMKVLCKARQLYQATDGLFDCAVGHEAIERGLLPMQNLGPLERGTFSAVEFVSSVTIRFSARIAIDLGGIAKGFAVDRAIAALRASGIREAQVNAGGDMRVMGDAPQPVHIRCPASAHRLLRVGLLRNAAIATSAGRATVPRGRVQAGSVASYGSDDDNAAYSVVAPTCLLADALTKVLAQLRDPRAACFAELGAMAFITRPDAIEGRAA
jgi:thiamine biosynthesis lipoprotein